MENVDAYVETEVALYRDWASHARRALAAAEDIARAAHLPWPLPLPLSRGEAR